MQTAAGVEPTTVTATKLRRDLGAVLEAVLKGTTVHVERSGRPMCVLVPIEAYNALIRPTPDQQ